MAKIVSSIANPSFINPAFMTPGASDLDAPTNISFISWKSFASVFPSLGCQPGHDPAHRQVFGSVPETVSRISRLARCGKLGASRRPLETNPAVRNPTRIFGPCALAGALLSRTVPTHRAKNDAQAIEYKENCDGHWNPSWRRLSASRIWRSLYRRRVVSENSCQPAVTFRRHLYRFRAYRAAHLVRLNRVANQSFCACLVSESCFFPS
jgi:hypothetical protein